MALEQIVQAGVNNLRTRGNHEKFQKDPYEYNPIVADIMAQGYDESNPQDRLDLETAQLVGLDRRENYVEGTVSESEKGLIDLVKPAYKEVVESIKPVISRYLIGSNPVKYSGVDDNFFRLYSEAFSANQTLEKLKSGDRESMNKAVEDYIQQVKSDSENAGRTKTRAGFTEFAVKLRPDIAINSITQSLSDKREEFNKFIGEKSDIAIKYLTGLFDSLKDDEKDKEAYKIGTFFTEVALESAKNRPKSP